VVAASGDAGSSDGVRDGPHVDFPACSPWVLACGGTRLVFEGESILDEVVWSDEDQGTGTGGGISELFDRPAWQAAFEPPRSGNPDGRPGRGVPDVAAHAMPGGYLVQMRDQDAVLGGTSAAAAMWAALIARVSQALGHPVGYITPLLYEIKRSDPRAFRGITVGSNGAYRAGPGWNACTGLGSPDGALLLEALRKRRFRAGVGVNRVRTRVSTS